MGRESGGNANAMSQLGTNPVNGPLTGLMQIDDPIRNITCRIPNK